MLLWYVHNYCYLKLWDEHDNTGLMIKCVKFFELTCYQIESLEVILGDP